MQKQTLTINISLHEEEGRFFLPDSFISLKNASNLILLIFKML